jgi:hypothetical protein
MQFRASCEKKRVSARKIRAQTPRSASKNSQQQQENRQNGACVKSASRQMMNRRTAGVKKTRFAMRQARWYIGRNGFPAPARQWGKSHRLLSTLLT